MSIFIISNRQVNNRTKKFKETNKAVPDFRIARIDDPKAENYTYTLIENSYPSNYDNVVKKVINPNYKTKLRGSGAMFYELYSDMMCVLQDSKKTKKDIPIVKNDVLFFIHGFNTPMEHSLNHMKELHSLYVEKESSPIRHIVYLSWPSHRSKILTYWGDQDNAYDTGALLARVYRKTQSFFFQLFELHEQQRCLGRIHLMAHSMGNQVLKSFMSNLSEEMLMPIVSEILLLHSDVEDDMFEKEKPFSHLAKISRRVHIYIHNGDDALRISRFTKNFNKRLGQRGPKSLSVLNDQTFIIDVTDNSDSVSLKEGVMDHWGYLERENEIADIISVLNGIKETRIEGRKIESEKRNYFNLS